ncbi:unnamed protein product [Didymodactylos carnosus]|uniref:Transposase n=1 Tax=Didymodactylos carnosus TaxID=1234261 RepID=A0A815TA66_9BILA|nr:unnamed protein product [Didymodactylos carnosus]CAF4363807.1 unnamed protein product [Didymodactylos carnosus]
MIAETGSIELSTSPGRPRIIRTKNTIKKVKNRLKWKKRVKTRKLISELKISRRSVQRILKNDLGLMSYKKRIEPLLTDTQKAKRITFANWVRHNFSKEQSLRILFSDEKMFDLSGMYNCQNDQVWAVNRAEADKNGGVKQNQQFPQKVMAWLSVCSEDVTPLVILDNGTVNHQRYIDEVLPVALKYGNNAFGDVWTFQQDGAKPHIHQLSQKWCNDHFPGLITKITGPRILPT